MQFVDQIVSLIVGIIVFLIGIKLLLTIIPSLYSGGVGFLISAAVIVFFIYIFVKKGLDL